ncbi:hypothetical protein V8D89_012604 [Ganoderma adspersum]
MSKEQVLHDQVNLARLVRRLEKTVTDETWTDDVLGASMTTPIWIRTRGALQKVKHARKLLLNVESSDDASDSSAPRRYDEFRKTLDRLEQLVSDVDKRVGPTISRPPPVLPTLPPPISADVPSSVEESLPETEPSRSDPATTLLPVEDAAHELLLTPSDSHALTRGPINPSEVLLPPSLPAAAQKSGTQATPAFMQNSAALQEELSAQLAQMATQLKRNAVHFASALEKDKAVVQETQEKLERNHDVMSKERVRLRDHHSKSWGTTWITILSLVVVLIGFFMTFLVIRIT